jgi:hypothetical protein
MARRDDNLQARLDRDLAELKLPEIAKIGLVWSLITSRNSLILSTTQPLSGTSPENLRSYRGSSRGMST